MRSLTLNRRTLYRYVDWNQSAWIGFDFKIVVPYIGTWIETPDNPNQAYDMYVVPYIGTWIETDLELASFNRMQSYLI